MSVRRKGRILAVGAAIVLPLQFSESPPFSPSIPAVLVFVARTIVIILFIRLFVLLRGRVKRASPRRLRQRDRSGE